MEIDRSDDLLNQGAEAYQTQTPEGFKTAVRYYEEAARLGNGQAMTNLGYCYMYGRGVTKNPEKGFRRFVEGAKRGKSGSDHEGRRRLSERSVCRKGRNPGLSVLRQAV